MISEGSSLLARSFLFFRYSSRFYYRVVYIVYIMVFGVECERTRHLNERRVCCR